MIADDHPTGPDAAGPELRGGGDPDAVLALLADGAPLPTVLDAVRRRLERALPGTRSLVAVLDAEAGGGPPAPTPAASPAGSEPPIDWEALADVAGAELLVDELGGDAPWAGDEGAAGARARWTTPLRAADGALLGALVLHRAHPGAPSPAERRVVAAARPLLRLALAQAASDERARRAERRFRAMGEHASDLVLVVGAEGAIRHVSPAVTAALGLDARALVGRLALDLVHPDDEPRVAAQLDALLRGEARVSRAEYRVRRVDGAWLHVATVAEQLLDEPSVRGVVVTARDVTERAALEAQLRQAQRMEALGHLAGGVAHDFNNLLLVIQASARFVGEALEPGSAAADDLAELRRATERATELTRQLLAFSRQQMLRPRDVRLSEVVGGLRAMLRRLLDAGVALEISHQPAPDRAAGDAAGSGGGGGGGADDLVHADPGQLEQVVVNLVVNARDALAEYGSIRVRTGVERVDAVDPARPGLVPGRYATLRVGDDGRGMDAATLARVFEPFFTTKPAGTGSGLGLATVYGIVKQSGGFVYGTSEPGRGTTFTVYLPLAGRATPERGASAGARARGSETVLLVDDEREVRRAVRKMLERAGYAVVEAADGRAALAALERPEGAAIAVVISDVVMPEMSGRELVAALRAHRPALPALLLSGYGEQSAPGHGAGGTAGVELLPKPFGAEELLDRVRALLDRGRVPPQAPPPAPPPAPRDG